jgi:hypothetical protein
MATEVVQDWVIDLYPAATDDRAERAGGWLDVVRGDRQDAIALLEHYADLIAATAAVPDGLDWRNCSPAAVVRRSGRLKFRVRVDSFEFEHDAGWNEGYGWLEARAHPD